MNATIRNLGFALLTSLTLISVSTASASQPNALLINPTLTPDQGCFELPKFGFSSFSINGFGERVTNVRWGGLAQQMGLENGDIILRLNGFSLTYHGSWNDALREAVNQGGFVQLTVRDVRTGFIATRETYIGGFGPVMPHSQVSQYHGPNTGPVTSKMKTMPHKYPQQNLNGPQQIKKIVELFDKKNNP